MKNLLSGLGMLLMAYSLMAQEKPIKVVFDISSSNTEVQRSAARHLRLMSESYPNSEFELVVYGGAYQMLDHNSSAAGETLRKIINNENV